jgi:hypothetical protein
MTDSPVLDAAGRRRSPATMPGLGTTSIYLQGIDPEEIIATVRMRRAPVMSASAGLRL